MATTNDYQDYLTLARTALEDSGEQAAEELRDIARLHRDSIGTDRPQDADRFEQELGQVLDQNRRENALAQVAEGAEEPPVPTYFGNGANAENNPYTRPGLDPAQRSALIERHEEEVEAYSDWLVEKHGAQTFEEHAEAYDTLSETAEITVTREDGFGVSVDFGEGVTVDGVDGRGMGRLAEAMADDPETAEAVREVLTGDLDPDAIDDRLAELEGLRPMGSGRIDGRSLPADLDGILTPALAAERDRLTAVAEALDARTNGAAPAEVLDILTGHLAPDPAEDYAQAAEIVGGFIPGIQQVIAAKNLAVDVQALQSALDEGDMQAAAQAGLFSILSVADLVPGFGKAAGALRSTLRRVITTAPGSVADLARRSLEFSTFFGRVTAPGYKPSNQARDLGTMSEDVASFVAAQGFDPRGGTILIRDKELQHLLRTSKRGRGAAIPEGYAERLPELIDQPSEVLWDSQDPALLYIFDVPSLGKKGKIMIRIDYNDKFSLPGETGNAGKRPGNFVRTAGLVDQTSLGLGRYQRIR